jgi:Protein of unknown function (DUF541)
MNQETSRSKDGRSVSRIAILVAAFAVLLFPCAALAQGKPSKFGSFWVTGTSAVTVKADRAVIVMEIRISSGLVGDAIAVNDQMTQAVTQELERRGLGGKYRFSGTHYLSRSASLMIQRAVVPAISGQPTCLEVKKYVFVTFDESDLANPAFDDILAGTIDALKNGGAHEPEQTPQPAGTELAGPVWFTVKDPQPVVLAAIRQAMEQARAQAEEIARISGRKLGPIMDARVNRPLMVELPRQQDLTILDELNLKYLGTSKDAVTIPATFSAQYSTK